MPNGLAARVFGEPPTWEIKSDVALTFMASAARIFLVEDHASTARALKMFLESCGYTILLAHDVGSALKVAAAEKFDLLICDVGLPDGTGWDLMKKLSAERPVRGIAYTASANDGDAQRSKLVGFIRHVIKGSSADDLVTIIEDVLRHELDGAAAKSRSSGRGKPPARQV